MNIVAFELGSSAIRGILGQRKADGSLNVLGYEKEPVTDWILKGVIHNYDKTTQAINAIVQRLEERHKVYINKAYVGVSGQSLRTVGNKVTKQFDVKVSITDDIIDSLREINSNQQYPGSEILEVLPQDYIVNGRSTNEPVGVQSDRIEGLFKNVIARRTLCQAINRCMTGAKVEVADVFIAPLFLAGYLLPEADRRSGCALVDFGAETTTIVVYEKNVLRHLVVIPLGGHNITTDIAALLHVEIDEAEKLKRTYGKAYIDDKLNEKPEMINVSGDRRIESEKLRDIIAARQQEILENVWHQLKGYADSLLAGVVFTGGAAYMPEIDNAFINLSHFDKKVVLRQMPTTLGYNTNLRLDLQSNNIATLISMLRRGDQECTSKIPLEPKLFEEEEKDENISVQPQAETEKGEGVVRKPITDEQSKPDVATETKAEEAATESEQKADQEVEQDLPKRPGLFSKLWKGFGDMVTKVTDPNT
ncbi:MAG: cell division protein FtsA [Bacteroidaceae bacterium]|nr:cell division protein FtsA [Bacteroidaceae bacterium]